MGAAVSAPAASGLRRDWVVTYRASSRSPMQIWALIVGVPAEADADEVSAALESWPRWPQWEARRGVQGVIGVVHRTARHKLDAGTVPLEWAQLAPAGKRIGLEVPGPVWAALTRHARAEGVSLNRFCAALLTAAAGAELGDWPGLSARPGFVDVPLPLAELDGAEGAGS